MSLYNQYPQNVHTIIFPNTIEAIYSETEISSMSYDNSNNLETVILSNSLKIIGDNVFSGCIALTNITIPKSVTNIGIWAFFDCSSLTSIAIPESSTSIEYGTFCGCGSLKNVTIPEDVTSIGYNAFYNCSNLTTVNYRGSQERWEAITIDSGNEDLTNATMNYNYIG